MKFTLKKKNYIEDKSKKPECVKVQPAFLVLQARALFSSAKVRTVGLSENPEEQREPWDCWDFFNLT